MKTTPIRRQSWLRGAERMGLTHMAISVGSEQGVNELTWRLEQDGYPILDGASRAGIMKAWRWTRMGMELR